MWKHLAVCLAFVAVAAATAPSTDTPSLVETGSRIQGKEDAAVLDQLGSFLGDGESIFGSDDSQSSKQKQEDELKKARLEAANSAAEAQRQYDAFYYNAMRFQEHQLRKHTTKHHHKHKGKASMRFREKRHRHKHRHKHHVHQFQQYPYATPMSFFQQYYAHPRFQGMYPGYPGMAGVPVPGMPGYGAPPANTDEDEDEDDEEEEKEEAAAKKKHAEEMRFKEQQKKSLEMFKYGDSMNKPAGLIETAENVRVGGKKQQATSGYGPPSSNSPPPTQLSPKNLPNLQFQSSDFLKPPAQAPRQVPQRAPVPPMMQQQQQQMPRFAQQGFQNAQGANTAAAGAMNNPNPTGVPMPYYPPSAAPPPAPNQVPAAGAMVNNVHPINMQMQSSSAAAFAANGATQAPGTNMSPQGAQGAVNGYPFNAFIQLDQEVLKAASQVPRAFTGEVKHEIIHPAVYRMANDPNRFHMRTPLHPEHTAPFPELTL